MPDLNSGALAAVADEVEIRDLAVTGQVPEQLQGTLIRNGPNPFSGRFHGNDVLNWWPEAAMVHAVTFTGGRASEYRNRWVRTQNWQSHFGTVEAESEAPLVATNPNVNVLEHAGELLAMAEGGSPIRINSRLETLGSPLLHPTLSTGVTAHPKLDGHTGELMYFRADWNTPFLTYGVLNADGSQRHEQSIDVAAPAMMHDMAITRSKSIVLDLGVGYDFGLLEQGHRIPLRWLPERRSRLGIISRHGGDAAWIDIEPCFIQHVVNAYDVDSTHLVLEAVRYPHYFCFDSTVGAYAENPLGVYWRYDIDLANGVVRESAVDDGAIELPRINDAYTGQQHRYVYAVQQPTQQEMRGLVRYDTQTGLRQQHSIPPGDQNSEPVFVPRPGALSENDGWVLSCVYRAATDTSDVVILNAQDMAAPPLATVHVGRRIPAGFHGLWVAS